MRINGTHASLKDRSSTSVSSPSLSPEPWLPDELWLEILEHLSSRQLFQVISFLSLNWNRLVRLVPIPIYGVLAIESERQMIQQHSTYNAHDKNKTNDACYPIPLFDLAFGPPSKGPLAIMKRFVSHEAFSDAWFCLHLYSKDCLDYYEYSTALITSRLQFLGIPQRFRIKWKFALDLNEFGRYQVEHSMPSLPDISETFPHLLLRDPPRSALRFIPSNTQSLMFWSITQTPDLTAISDFGTLTSLRLEADTLLPETVGGMLSKVFRPLIGVRDTLESLCLQGPWTHNMQASASIAFGIFSQMYALRSFIADLDMIEHTAAALYSLFTSLPNLTEIGRLGRVDNRFWRLFPKRGASRIRHLILGNRRYFFTGRWSPNPNFLSDLGFGVNWAFPDLECLSVSLGFQSDIDTDDLLELVKTIKNGPVPDDELVPSKPTRPSSKIHRDPLAPTPSASSSSRQKRATPNKGTKSKSEKNTARRKRQWIDEDMMPPIDTLSLKEPPIQWPPPLQPKKTHFLKRIMFYQASDIDTLHISKWEYVCSTYAGYSISLYITTGDTDVPKAGTTDYGNEQYRAFGSYQMI